MYALGAKCQSLLWKSVSVLGLQKWQNCHGIKPINCELWNWNCSFGFIFFCILNIEIQKLFKTYTAYVDGSFWLCIFNYVLISDKGLVLWQAFCVQFNKTVSESCLQIVCLWVGDQGKKLHCQQGDVIFSVTQWLWVHHSSVCT